MEGLDLICNTRIKKMCSKHKITFFDHAMSDPKRDRSELSFDGLHLTKSSEIELAMRQFINLIEGSND